MCVNSASTVLRGGRSTIYRKVKRLTSTRLVQEGKIFYIRKFIKSKKRALDGLKEKKEYNIIFAFYRIRSFNAKNLVKLIVTNKI